MILYRKGFPNIKNRFHKYYDPWNCVVKFPLNLMFICPVKNVNKDLAQCQPCGQYLQVVLCCSLSTKNIKHNNFFPIFICAGNTWMCECGYSALCQYHNNYITGNHFLRKNDVKLLNRKAAGFPCPNSCTSHRSLNLIYISGWRR